MVVLWIVLEIVVIETPDAHNFTYIDDYGVYANLGDNVLFKVRAKSDAHVALTRYQFYSFYGDTESWDIYLPWRLYACLHLTCFLCDANGSGSWRRSCWNCPFCDTFLKTGMTV